ncbi:MAG TPA: hypothetical protein VNK96_07345 [Fimbriimonadales bacterium]|nr:hypothetical protein [Fimbriimonadales bacterium]
MSVFRNSFTYGLTILGLFAAKTAMSQTYYITDLGVLPGFDSSFGYGISEAGDAAGYLAPEGSFDFHAFFWTEGGGMQDIGTLGGPSSVAQGVNSSQVVVGYSDLASAAYEHAFRWTDVGGMDDLGTLGGNFSRAFAINDSGVIAGESQIADNTFRAFKWTESDGMINLGTLGGSYSYARGINAGGQITGTAAIASGDARAFRWTEGVGMENLGTLPGHILSNGLGINDAGDVVGYSSQTGTTYLAFVYKDGVGMTELVGLYNYDNRARDINNLGDAVGHSWLSPDGSTAQAVIWRDGAVYNLNDLLEGGAGWHLIDAYAINDSGEIVGYGKLNDETRAYKLTPVPEPSCIFMLSGALVVLLRRRK